MFRFTLRDLLWLMVVVAIGVGWFAEHRRMKLLHAKEIAGFEPYWETLRARTLQLEGMNAAISEAGFKLKPDASDSRGRPHRYLLESDPKITSSKSD